MRKPPFKVICIDGVKAGLEGKALEVSGYYFMTSASSQEEIYETKDYTVIATAEHLGALYYQLAERPETVIYHSERFVILPDQSADEMQEEKHEALIYQR